MGLKIKRPGGDTHFVWDDEVCEKLAERYLGISAQNAQSAQVLENNKEFKCKKKSRRRIKTRKKVHKKKHNVTVVCNVCRCCFC